MPSVRNTKNRKAVQTENGNKVGKLAHFAERAIDINTEDPNISKKNINAGMREQERRAEDASDTTVKKTAAQRYAELNALWDDIDVMGEVLKLVKVRIFVEGRTYDECDKRVKSVLDRLDAAGYEASIFLNEEINDFRSVYLPYTKQQELEEAKVYSQTLLL